MSDMKLKGQFILEHKNAEGVVLNRVETDNIIVNDGYNQLLGSAFKLEGGTRPEGFGYIAIGTGTSTPEIGNTTLDSESGREASGYSEADYGIGLTYCKVTTSFTNINGSIAEAGIFNDPSAGHMFDRVIFTAIPLTDSDTLDTTFQITISPT